MLKQHGTYMYHPHFDEMTQIAMGIMGFFIIHPGWYAQPSSSKTESASDHASSGANRHTTIATKMLQTLDFNF
jgi:FtsP/CotA-like multicopper oxidase with cupredoxin domain